MARGGDIEPINPLGFPHPRGDGPKRDAGLAGFRLISPPAWGWPVAITRKQDTPHDFPTRVGMARSSGRSPRRPVRFPHPRGDGPTPSSVAPKTSTISPPAWGWPDSNLKAAQRSRDFPTRVGMARCLQGLVPLVFGFPHPRGDGPDHAFPPFGFRRISPPAWGWPGWRVLRCQPRDDFPTRVGMARILANSKHWLGRFPHPRWDGPI